MSPVHKALLAGGLFVTAIAILTAEQRALVLTMFMDTLELHGLDKFGKPAPRSARPALSLVKS